MSQCLNFSYDFVSDLRSFNIYIKKTQTVTLLQCDTKILFKIIASVNLCARLDLN